MPKARAPLDLGGNKLTSVANGSASGDGVPLGQADGRYGQLATASTYTADQRFASGRPWFDVTATAFAGGADPSGVTDSAAAIQAAITAAGTAGGTVFFPQGNYTCSAALVSTSSKHVTLQGPGGVTAGAASGAKLLFTGTGSGSFITAGNCDGFHVSGLQVLCSNSGFTGYLIDVRGGSGPDSAFWKVSRCLIGGSGAGVNATAGIALDKANTGLIEECSFEGTVYGILGRASGSSYSNAVTVRDCHFVDLATCGIRNPGQGWVIDGNTFENLTGGGAGAITCDSGAGTYGTHIHGNWFGDATTGTGPVIAVNGSFVITGNYIGFATGMTAIAVGASSVGFRINGNRFDNSGGTGTTAISLGSGCASYDCSGNGSPAGMPSPLTDTLSAGSLTLTTPLAAGSGGTGSATVTGAAYAAKPATTDAVCYVSKAASASDANDGLSLGSAKATLAAAVTALGSGPGVIRMGAGTWTITSPAAVNIPLAVEGIPGATVISTSTANTPVFAVTANNVTLTGLTLTGPQFAAFRSSEKAVTVLGSSASAPVTGFTMRDCVISNWGYGGLYLQYVSGFTVERCTVTNVLYAAVMVLSGAEGMIRGNLIDTVTGTGEPDCYGIALTRNDAVGTTLTTDPRTTEVTVTGNRVRNVTTWEGIDTHGGTNLDITGNQVYGCYRGIAINNCPDATGAAAFAPHNVSVSGNIVDSTALGAGLADVGIVVQGAITTAGSPTECATGCTITGNTVTGCGLQGNNLSGAILGVATYGLQVTGNTIHQPSPFGVMLYHDNYGFTVSGNTVTDAWSSSYTLTSGVAVRSGWNTGHIGSNSYVRPGSLSATFLFVNGTYITSGITNSSVALGYGYCDPAIATPLSDVSAVSKPLPVASGGTGTATAAQNGVFAGPATGGTGAPSFRALATTDVPTLNQNTTGTAANLSGTPALPTGTTAATQTTGDSTTKIATDAFVATAVAGETTRAQAAETLLAPKASPALTGTPTAPTAAALTGTTQVATTAYADSAAGAEKTRAQAAEALLAPLASPALTGSPTAPTQTAGDATTKIATDQFVATAVAAETTRAETAEALRAPMAPAPTGVAATDTAALQAALTALPAGQRLTFQGGSYLINAPLTPPNGATLVAARGCTVTQATQGYPVFDLFNVSNVTIGDGFTLVNGSGTISNAVYVTLPSFRGDAGYAYSAGVWCNTSGNTVGDLRIKDFAMGVYFNASNGTVNSTGTQQTGNTIGNLEVSGCNHGALFLSQKGLRVGNLYVHDHADSTAGGNPNHAVYLTGTSSLPHNDVTVGDSIDVNNPTGVGFQFKYVLGLTFGRLLADTTQGITNMIDCMDVTGTSAESVNDQINGTSFTIQKSVNQPARINVGTVTISYGVDNPAAGAMALICDDSRFGGIVINAMHNTLSGFSELQLRGNRVTVDGVKLRNSGSSSSYGIGIGTSANPTSDCTVANFELNGYRNLVAVDASATGNNAISYNPAAQRNIAGALNYIEVTGGSASGTYTISRGEHTNVYPISGGATATPLPAMETLTMLTVSDGTAFTIAAPAIGVYTGLTHSVAISNTSGGTLGTITWNSAWTLRSALAAPAAGDTIRLSFVYDGAHWIEVSRTYAGALITSTPEIIPSDVGCVAWTAPPGCVSVGANVHAGFAGDLNVWAFKSGNGGLVSSIYYGIDVPGTGLVNCYLGIYSWAGTLLASCTTDQSTNMMAAAAGHAAALASAYTLAPNTLYRVGLVVGTDTAMPTFAGAGANLGAGFTNLGLSAANSFAGTITGTNTSLPSSFTPSSLGFAAGLPVFVLA